MRLLILEQGDYTETGYRGTGRYTPNTYWENYPDDHPLNQAMRWYDKITAEEHIFGDDLDKAREVLKLFSAFPELPFVEIIEVTRDQEAPESGSIDFLGYDLSADYGWSLLRWAYVLMRPEWVDISSEKDDVKRLEPLLKLIHLYFQPKLNTSGLFDDYEVASFCLDAMRALHNFCPNLWESKTTMAAIEVIGIWKVADNC